MTREFVLTSAPLRVARSLLSGRTAVTANPRAAQAIAAKQSDSLADLARRSLPAGRRVAPEAVANRELAAAVRHVIGGQHAARQAAVMAGGLARLFRAGADLDHLVREGSERVKLLAEVAREYQARLEHRCMVDQAAMLHVAAQHGPERGRILVYGYARLDADERAFLEACAGDGSVLVLPDGAKTLFDENKATAAELLGMGWTRREVTPEGDVPLGEQVATCWATDQPFTGEGVEVFECANPEDEVRVVLAEVKRLLLAGAKGSEISVVARDEDLYVPLVTKVAAECQMPVHPQTSGALAETRLGVYLGRLLTMLVEQAPYEITLCALADPLSGGLPDEQRREAQSRRASGFEAWREIAGHGELFDRLADDQPRPLAEWIGWLRQLMDASELPARLIHWPRELLAWEKLRDGLNLLDGGDEPVDAEQFALEILDLLGSDSVRLDVSRGGAMVHTPLALYGSAYPSVFVLGTAAGQLPATLHEDPFLDTHERAGLTTLGVPQESAVQQALRERLSFWMMLQAAQQRLVLCRPRVIDRAETEPSAFLRHLKLPTITPEPILASVAAARAFELDAPEATEAIAARHAWDVECRRESNQPADAYDGVLGQPVPMPRTFSVSSLITLGQCPFRWLCRYRWRLEPLDETAAEPDAALLGSLYHGVLELVVKGAKRLGFGVDANAMIDLLEPAMAAQLEEEDDGSVERAELNKLKAEREPTGHDDDEERRQAKFKSWSHWPILRAEVLHLLAGAIASEDFLKDVAEADEFEFTLTGEYEGLPVLGRVDRSDRLNDDGRRLLDYKSGSGGRPPGIQDPDGKLSVDVQLPLYAALYEAERGIEPEVGYYRLGSGKLVREPRDAEGNRVLVRGFAHNVPARLAEGALPVAPDVDEQACRYCDFELVCRIGPRIARKGVG